MKLFYYCQHVLGIGHFHRSMALCRQLAKKFEVTLILGGPPVAADLSGMQVIQLPGLQMDNTFSRLTPCDETLNLEAVKKTRSQMLCNIYRTIQPDILITELYPFGRKAFRFELDPLLDEIQKDEKNSCKCFSSVRDILVEKTEGKEKFEMRVVKTLNRYFDGVLIHGDPEIVLLARTFGRFSQITIPCYYTGYIVPQSNTIEDKDLIEPRDLLHLPRQRKLIVASIGGGNVGGKLLESSARAVTLLKSKEHDIHLQIFTGPYCSTETINSLNHFACSYITVDRFTDNFIEWLKAADLSISMGGYNTSMNLAQSGIPALVLPFGQNQEQRMRAELLEPHCGISILSENDCSPPLLAERILGKLKQEKKPADILLNGAEKTVTLLKRFIKKEEK